MRPARTTQGFTLLELMVALSIFTIISTGAYFMLSGLLGAERHVAERSDDVSTLQRWLMISDRDMLQMTALHSANATQLVFTRRGWSNPLGMQRSELQRVEYHFDQGQLERIAGTTKQPLLDHVQAFSARFLDRNGQWQASWAAANHSDALPQAIELNISIDGIGAVRQVFPLQVMSMSHLKPQHIRERGAALLLMVMACAFAAVIAAVMIVRQHTSIEQAQRYFAYVQASQYARGAELWARQLLFDDLAAADASDNLQEKWSTPEVKFADEQVTIAMSIEDLQGRFNLNSMTDDGTAQSDLFKRLLASLNIKFATDTDISPAPAPVPKLPEKIIADPTQLIEQGMSVADFQKLRPFITTLPPDSVSINVNTASETLLKVAVPDNTQRNFILDRRKTKQPLVAADMQSIGLAANNALNVKSRFFQASITVTYQDKNYTWRAVIRRNIAKDGTITVETIARAFNREDNMLK